AAPCSLQRDRCEPADQRRLRLRGRGRRRIHRLQRRTGPADRDGGGILRLDWGVRRYRRHRRPGADPGFRAAVGRGRVLALEAAPGALGRRPMKTGPLGIAFASILLVAACGGGTVQPSPSAAGAGAATTPPRATVRVAIGSAASLKDRKSTRLNSSHVSI